MSLRTQSHFVIQFGVSLCSAGVLVYHRLPAVRNFGLGMQTSVLWTFALSFGVELSSSCYRRLVCNIGSVRTIPSEIGRSRPLYFRRMTRRLHEGPVGRSPVGVSVKNCRWWSDGRAAGMRVVSGVAQ